MIRVTEVKVLEPYSLWLRFSDGVEGTIDLSALIGQGVFRALSDPQEFAKVAVDEVTHTVTWPSGVDLCPDSLYEDIKAQTKAA
jgi:hypothetical protein